MKPEQQEPTTLTDRHESVRLLNAKIKDIRIAMLTTTDTDGTMRSRPMGTQETEFDGTLWFFTSASSEKIQAVQNDQHVNVSYSNPDKNVFVSVAGRGTVINDRAKMQQLWKPILKAWFPDGVDDPDLRLLRVDVEGAQIWDSPSGKLTVLVSFAKSLLTGKPMEEGTGTKKIDLRH